MNTMAGMGTPSPTKHYTHMTFFWGKNSEILFPGWPATRGGMYALALIFVFVLGVLAEYVSHRRFPFCDRSSRVTGGLVQTVVYGFRVGLVYLLMLAVMSFNGGVLIVAVAGHAVGYLLFGSKAFRKDIPPPSGKSVSDNPSPCIC